MQYSSAPSSYPPRGKFSDGEKLFKGGSYFITAASQLLTTTAGCPGKTSEQCQLPGDNQWTQVYSDPLDAGLVVVYTWLFLAEINWGLLV